MVLSNYLMNNGEGQSEEKCMNISGILFKF
jgi:hypothetical protein